MATSEGGEHRYELSDRYLADEGTVFLTGIQALARLPLEQLRADRRAGLDTAALVSGSRSSSFAIEATRRAKSRSCGASHGTSSAKSAITLKS